MLNHLKSRKYLFITFVCWLFSGFFPLICILLEFGGIGFSYASFYSPLFFYPLIFGFCSVYLSLRPVLFFLKLPREQKFGLSVRTLLAYILIFSIAITVVELSGKPAVWEVKRAAIENTIAGNKAAYQQLNDWNKFMKHFKEHPKDPKRENYVYADGDKQYQAALDRLKAVRGEFDDIIVKSAKEPKNWSVTRYFYVISFLIQELTLLSLFTVISFTSNSRFEETLLRETKTTSDRDKLKAKFKFHSILLSFSVSISLIWLHMRFSFESDKLGLYGQDLISTPAATYLIGFAYVLALVYLTVKLRFEHDDTFQVIYNLIAAALGIALTVYNSFSQSNPLGSNATPQNYIACLIAVFIVLSPWYFMYQDKLKEYDN